MESSVCERDTTECVLFTLESKQNGSYLVVQRTRVTAPATATDTLKVANELIVAVAPRTHKNVARVTHRSGVATASR